MSTLLGRIKNSPMVTRIRERGITGPIGGMCFVIGVIAGLLAFGEGHQWAYLLTIMCSIGLMTDVMCTVFGANKN